MIDLVGKRNWFFLISAIVIIPGIISLAVFGLKPGVDFSSGTAMTLHFDKAVELGQLRQQLTGLGYDQAIVQPAGEGDFFVRLPEMSTDQTTKLKDSLQTGVGATLTISSLYTVSPIVAAGTVRNTFIAVVVAAIGILLYISWAFRKMPNPIRWGTCAIIALLHDLIVVIAIFSILGWLVNMEVDALFVTGVLAVVGVSVNNIVVVFDRIRENTKRGVSRDFAVVANYGIVESLGRSLNTGLATLFVIVALYLLGGATTHTLVLALLIGIATGIYSSLCIAGQLLVVWEKGFSPRKKAATTTV
ncbi:MAG: protein translocase subunit SecF [Dehalococcoidia bacterium]|nr:protein translocase subunit SecF [Dehalococcoidia bacterium]